MWCVSWEYEGTGGGAVKENLKQADKLAHMFFYTCINLTTKSVDFLNIKYYFIVFTDKVAGLSSKDKNSYSLCRKKDRDFSFFLVDFGLIMNFTCYSV